MAKITFNGVTHDHDEGDVPSPSGHLAPPANRFPDLSLDRSRGTFPTDGDLTAAKRAAAAAAPPYPAYLDASKMPVPDPAPEPVPAPPDPAPEPERYVMVRPGWDKVAH